MSPAQLHRRPDKNGYIGTAVDVWASGVLLVVMLLGERTQSCLQHMRVNGTVPPKAKA